MKAKHNKNVTVKPEKNVLLENLNFFIQMFNESLYWNFLHLPNCQLKEKQIYKQIQGCLINVPNAKTQGDPIINFQFYH